MSKRIKRIGDWVERTEVLAYCRGGAVNQGETRQFDLDASDAAVNAFDPSSSTANLQAETNVFGSTVPVDTAGIANLFPIGICNEPGGIADDAFGWWGLDGVFEIAMKDDDVAGADIDNGTALICTNGVDFVTGLTAASRLLGVALEDAAADSNDTDRLIDGSSHLRWGLWFGGIPGKGMYAPA